MRSASRIPAPSEFDPKSKKELGRLHKIEQPKLSLTKAMKQWTRKPGLAKLGVRDRDSKFVEDGIKIFDL